MMEKMLIKIPLQFFGEPADDYDDDFDEAFEEDEEAFDEEEEDVDEDEEEDEGEVADADIAGAGGSEKGSDAYSDLIADLKALGFKGDSLAELSASVKARREAKDASGASAERAAAQAAGKSHIKGSKPGRSASGELLEGFTAKDIAEVNACLKNPNRGEKGRARAALERAVRAK